MWLDAQSLYDFYKTDWGLQVRATLSGALVSLWPQDPSQQILGLGYALPYLKPLVTKGQSVAAFLPQRMGTKHWPDMALDPEAAHASKGRINLTSLVSGDSLPLADQAIDRALIIHCFEFADDLQALCDELYRSLHNKGEILIVLPNRAGLWSRSERSPFGYGTPFTPGQVTGILRNSGFEVTNLHGALYYPPRPNPFLMRHANRWEKIGGSWAKLVAGVQIVQAKKPHPPISFSREKKDAMQPLRDLLAGIQSRPAPAILQPAPQPNQRRMASYTSPAML